MNRFVPKRQPGIDGHHQNGQHNDQSQNGPLYRYGRGFKFVWPPEKQYQPRKKHKRAQGKTRLKNKQGCPGSRGAGIAVHQKWNIGNRDAANRCGQNSAEVRKQHPAQRCQSHHNQQIGYGPDPERIYILHGGKNTGFSRPIRKNTPAPGSTF